jgi:protein-S-isoprenylcysteine O-methyltransferase Ste14
MALVLFGSAGTIRYGQAWAYLAVFAGGALLVTRYLEVNDPALLERRAAGGPAAENEPAQRIIMLFASTAFIAALAVPALDHRFRWSNVPLAAAVTGDVLTALCFYVTFLVFRENTFASATIEIARDHTVISTGPYAVVRHPMYAGGLLVFIGTPLALGSAWGMLTLAVALPALVFRLLDEERFLRQQLPGYAAYCARVRWRLVPGVF